MTVGPWDVVSSFTEQLHAYLRDKGTEENPHTSPDQKQKKMMTPNPLTVQEDSSLFFHLSEVYLGRFSQLNSDTPGGKR